VAFREIDAQGGAASSHVGAQYPVMRVPPRLPVVPALLSALLAACSNDGLPVEMYGTLERDRLELVAEARERIVEIAVAEGDHVAAGTLLLRQEAGTMQPRLDQARAALQESERRLADLAEGPRQREIEEARASLAGAESTLVTARREFERVDSLVARRLLSASQLDQARAQRDAARSARDQAKSRLALLLEGTRPEQVRQAEAAVQRARAALAELETSAALYSVIAPRDGLVEALPYKLGERPPAGAPVVVMLADGVPYARIHVPEPLRAEVTAGRRVFVAIDGVEGQLEGTVRFVAAQAEYTPYYALSQKDRSRLSFKAEVTVHDARAAALPVGVPVQVTLDRSTAETGPK
jgi:HlyD family secretion protein